MKELTLRISSSKTDRHLAAWLAEQADPAKAAKQLLTRAVAAAEQRDAELTTLRGQVQSLIAVLDRLTAAGLGEQAAAAAGLAGAAGIGDVGENGFRPVAVKGPRRADKAGLVGDPEADPDVDPTDPDVDPAAQVDEKLSKVLDFGDF